MEALFPFDQKLVILDGGAGTTLEDEFGFKLTTQVWSAEVLLERPDVLSKLHQAWEDAGAQIVMTASYQATLGGFEALLSATGGKCSSSKKETSLALLRSSVSIARQALSLASTRVALSLGPYGATLKPGQEYTGWYPDNVNNQSRLADFHLKRLMDYATDRATWDAVDIVVFETVPNLVEARAIRRAWAMFERSLQTCEASARGDAAGVAWCRKPWVISFVFPGPDGEFPTGERPAEVLQAALDPDPELADPSGIGINCTKLHHLPAILESWISSALPKPLPWLWLYPDGGPVYDSVRRCWSGSLLTSEQWAKTLLATANQVSASTRGIVLGGCCKAGTPHIRALAKICSPNT